MLRSSKVKDSESLVSGKLKTIWISSNEFSLWIISEDEFTAHRIKQSWRFVLNETLTLENEKDFSVCVVTASRSLFCTKLKFISSQAKLNFWRISTGRMPGLVNKLHTSPTNTAKNLEYKNSKMNSIKLQFAKVLSLYFNVALYTQSSLFHKN